MYRPTNIPLQIILLSLLISPVSGGEKETEFFETRIRPVLIKHCYECHSQAAAEIQGELVVDHRDGLRKGGETGKAVVPGMPQKSLLLAALRYESLEMPPAGKLPDQVIADFETWIRNGASDPRDKAPTAQETADQAWQAQLDERRHWWSLQAPKPVEPPTVSDAAWMNEPIDRFILSALENAELPPAPPAEPAILFRRLTLMLTGLPPSPSQIGEFEAERVQLGEQLAVENAVDRLLTSPHFGERFARHWMDVVRYTDTYGYEWDNPAKGSWEYRDYLIRAFNDDVPFDQLIREQVAGDLLTEPRINVDAQVNESLIGPMFFHLGEHRHGGSLDFNGIHQEMVNNKIDAFSKTFLAMTVACARCHDHKLDAISQADYYALAGVFMSPRWTSRVIDAPGKNDDAIVELKRIRDEIHTELSQSWSLKELELPISLKKWAEENKETKTTLGQIAYPLLKVASADEAERVATWQATADEWRAAREQRVKANADKFVIVRDFAKPGFPDDWIIEGDGLKHGYVDNGIPLISLTDDNVIQQLLPRGYHTHAISSKLAGGVRLPAQDLIPGQHVSLQLRGGEWAGYLVAPQNAFQSEVVKFLEPKLTSPWVTLTDNGLKNGVTRVLSEVVTAPLNPNFPPRTGLARAGATTLAHDDDGLDKRSWFSLTKVVRHDAAGAPQETMDVFENLYNAEPPTSESECWEKIGAWFGSASSRWSDGKATTADVQLINWLIEHQLVPNRFDSSPHLTELVTEYRRIENDLAFPRTANSMEERGVRPVAYRLNIRGDVDREGDAIPRRFLEVFGKGETQVAASEGSGRLELAEYLSSSSNPQTARVYVNRVWHWVFGAGIVATPGDFGKLGATPTHPELLDWLAIQFVEEGWSTKKLVRRLVLSQTFRQSGLARQAALELDPDNRLLHHYPTRRLEAEAIRDSLLAVSGRLDKRLYGRPINPTRYVEDPAKRLYSGPVDSHGRRSIYMKMSIMDPPKFLVGFNLPDLKLPTGRRDVTNVPAQALALLNDPLVLQLAEHWGTQVVGDDAAGPEERVRRMFARATSRQPQDHELHRWTAAVVAFSESNESPGADIMKDERAWSDLAHVFFNMKEFIYYR
jgi:hypothetical protein